MDFWAYFNWNDCSSLILKAEQQTKKQLTETKEAKETDESNGNEHIYKQKNAEWLTHTSIICKNKNDERNGNRDKEPPKTNENNARRSAAKLSPSSTSRPLQIPAERGEQKKNENRNSEENYNAESVDKMSVWVFLRSLIRNVWMLLLRLFVIYIYNVHPHLPLSRIHSLRFCTLSSCFLLEHRTPSQRQSNLKQTNNELFGKLVCMCKFEQFARLNHHHHFFCFCFRYEGNFYLFIILFVIM